MLIFFPVQVLQPLHDGLLICSHTLTSKRKSSKKKIRYGGERLRAGKGGKGAPKSAAYGGLKRKSPPPFPPGSGHGNDGKPYGFTTFPQPPPTPLFPSDFLPKKEYFLLFGDTIIKGQLPFRGAYIINKVFPYFRQAGF